MLDIVKAGVRYDFRTTSAEVADPSQREILMGESFRGKNECKRQHTKCGVSVEVEAITASNLHFLSFSHCLE